MPENWAAITASLPVATVAVAGNWPAELPLTRPSTAGCLFPWMVVFCHYHTRPALEVYPARHGRGIDRARRGSACGGPPRPSRHGQGWKSGVESLNSIAYQVVGNFGQL
ncbi:hypothetical protein BO71DRAFT_199877 [Aspergillus ellipticus CBS 707.79]|uniref:Uncharacterized protein n=1 Tax=Aspergillus ellipticus CBS 707.79 TaxID=1448320 RepID=A0A319DE19_9EURO|nr:hypothetical protein BO71DRAFT_199877 [Aspergillus ellipticus CBS 707.79]